MLYFLFIFLLKNRKPNIPNKKKKKKKKIKERKSKKQTNNIKTKTLGARICEPTVALT